MSSVQMNVRIDCGLKEKGDAVFAELGYTPTEIVRKVWGFACRNRGNQRAVVDLVRLLRDQEEVDAEESARAERMRTAEEWLGRGPLIIREYFAQQGVDYDAQPPLSQEDYDRLLEESYAEKHPELWSA